MALAGMVVVLALTVPVRDSQALDAVGCCSVTGHMCSYSQQNCPPVHGMSNYCFVGCSGSM
jgi:hypothetical protein